MDPALMQLLGRLRKSGQELLKPRPQTESFCGYAYPQAQDPPPAKPGDEIPRLESLADLGLLDRVFFDRVRLCPHCSSCALNFREVCPRCASSDLAAEPGKPASGFRCAACRNAFAAPVLSCLCLRCGQAFAPDRAVNRPLYAYRLTEKAARTETPAVKAPAPDRFAAAVMDTKLAVYTFRFFEELLSQEVARAVRYQRPLSVLLTAACNVEAFLSKAGEEAVGARLKEMALVIKDAVRNTDLPALEQGDRLAVLLPETPAAGAYIVAERIRKRSFDLSPAGQEPRITLAVGLASLSETPEDGGRILSLAEGRLDEAVRAGGNCVRPEPLHH